MFNVKQWKIYINHKIITKRPDVNYFSIVGNMLEMIEGTLNNNDLSDNYTYVNKSFSRNGTYSKIW